MDSKKIFFSAIVATALLTATSSSQATEKTPPSARAPADRVEIGAHAAVFFEGWDWGTNTGARFGVNGFYRVIPYVAVGGYIDYSGFESCQNDGCYYHENRSTNHLRLMAMGRVEPLPSYVVGPWAAMGLGGVFAPSGRDAGGWFFLEGNVGVDFRVPHVSFGPYIFGAISPAAGDRELIQFGAAFRVAARF